MALRDVSPSEAVRILNEALAADPEAINDLMGVHSRVECNRDLALHETIQVSTEDAENGPYYVGPLGIINGMFQIPVGVPGYLAYNQNDDGTIKEFVVVWGDTGEPG